MTLHFIIFILVYVSESYWIKKQLEMKNSNYKCPLDGCWNDVPSKITNDCRVKEKCQNKEKWIDEKKTKTKIVNKFFSVLRSVATWAHMNWNNCQKNIKSNHMCFTSVNRKHFTKKMIQNKCNRGKLLLKYHVNWLCSN